MQIEVRQDGDISVLTLDGELDARSLPDASAAVAGEFAKLRFQLVFNLAGLTLVTSSTISFLIDIAKRARNHGGDAVVSEPTRLLRKSLDVLNLTPFFVLFDDDHAAVAHLRDAALDDTVRPGEMPNLPDDWRERFRFWKKG